MRALTQVHHEKSKLVKKVNFSEHQTIKQKSSHETSFYTETQSISLSQPEKSNNLQEDKKLLESLHTQKP